jgi:Lrp/AsnC family leucine-responsive transcriptional regulator
VCCELARQAAQGDRLVELDRIDRNILKLLQEDNQITNLDLADRVGLSPAACLRRVRRLTAEGVIAGNIAILDPALAGIHVTVVVDIKLARSKYELMEEFKRKMRQSPEVSQCYLVTGRSDFILVVQVRDMAEYELFIQSKLYNDPIVESMNSMVVVSRVKFRPQVPLSDDDTA